MKLRFVICGVEHSGTTLVSDLFRQVEGVDSGFEVGVLLGETPSDFRQMPPFSENIKAGWGITEADMDHICSAESFSEFYSRLGQASTIVDHSAELFDKTPRYLAKLDECLAKVDAPFIATYKDPRSIVASDFQRAGTPDFDTWYHEYKEPKLGYMRTLYSSYAKNVGNPRVAFASLESISVDTERTMQRVFEHVGLTFNHRFLLLKNLRYRNTYSAFIDMRAPFKYLETLSAHQAKRIHSDFSELADWFYGA